MRKKAISSMIPLIIILVFSMNIVFAYEVSSFGKPASNSITLIYHSTLPSSAKSGIQAAKNTWNNAGNFTLTIPTSISYGTFSTSDTRNEIAQLECSLHGGSSTTLALVYKYPPGQKTEYDYVDMIFDDDPNFADTSSDGYFDWQGIATHELGHVIGLGDVYPGDTVVYPNQVEDVTMYGFSDDNPNTSYKKRTLTTDDTTGLDYLW